MQCKWNVIWDGIQDMLDLQAIGIGCVTLAGVTRVKPQKYGESVVKERKREYDEAVVEAKKTEQEYNNCVFCKGK